MTFATWPGERATAGWRLFLGSFADAAGVAGYPLPPHRGDESARQDGMDLPHGASGHRLAAMWLTPLSRAIMVGSTRAQPRRPGSHAAFADERAAPLPGGDQPLLGEHGQGVPGAGGRHATFAHLAHRRQPFSRPELSGADRLGERVGDLPVCGTGISWVDCENRHIAVLGEGPASACEIAAPAEPRVERVQHGAAQFPQLHATQGRLDRAVDISLVAFPGGDVQIGDGHVLVEQVAHRGGRLRLLAD